MFSNLLLESFLNRASYRELFIRDFCSNTFKYFISYLESKLDKTIPGEHRVLITSASRLKLYHFRDRFCKYLRRDTVAFYEYAMMFGTSVEAAVNRVSWWSPAQYTHLNSCYITTCSFLNLHQNSQANLTEGNQKQGS